MAKDFVNQVGQVTRDFLDQLGFGPEVVVTVNQTDGPDEVRYEVSLQTTQPALVIGYHGETLSALQLFLSQHLKSKTGEWLNLSVNVNDYRERRESTLSSLADSVAQRVISTGQPHSLPPMSAGERRTIHMHLADHPQVITTSEGVGRSRSVIISPKP